jgi:hypothetical protein
MEQLDMTMSNGMMQELQSQVIVMSTRAASLFRRIKSTSKLNQP